MLQIWADEMRTIWKDEGVLIFFILVPLFYPLLYSWIYTNEVVREVPVAVVDLSHSAMSREFIRQFDASPDVRVARYCTNLDEAKDVVGRQDAFGVIYFPTDFQTRVSRMEQSRVSVFCDMSFMLYYKAIFQTATAVAGNVNSKILIERAGNWTEREDEITAKPLDFDEVQLFNSTGGFGHFIISRGLFLLNNATLLLRGGLQEKLLAQVVYLLQERGLLLKKGTIVDSTLIAAPSSTKNREKKRDPEAHSVKKGNSWHFGYKAHIGVDKDSGLVHTVKVTSANIHDVTMVLELLTGDEDSVYGDSGYLGAEKREDAVLFNGQGKRIRYKINRRPSQSKHADNRSRGQIKRREKEKSSVRAKVEHVFGVVKGQLRYRKTRYRGLRKQIAKLNILFALANLILADRRSCLTA